MAGTAERAALPSWVRPLIQLSTAPTCSWSYSMMRTICGTAHRSTVRYGAYGSKHVSWDSSSRLLCSPRGPART